MVKVSTASSNRHASFPHRYVMVLLVITVTSFCLLNVDRSYESQEKILAQLLTASAPEHGSGATPKDAEAEFTGQQQLNHKPCAEYDGVLLISLGPKLAAAGTILFQYVINQLLYAELHNLQPWVYLSSTLRFIYDAKAHDGSLQITHMGGMVVSWTNESYPGPPVLEDTGNTLQLKEFSFSGDGIWNHYFEAVSDYNPSKVGTSMDDKERECYQKQPLLQMTPQHLKPGFHKDCPYAVRSWRYGDLPPHIAQPNLSYKDWYWPMRQRGYNMVKKYIRFRPALQQAAERANPIATIASTTVGTARPASCLAIHVRHSDKSAERRVVSLKEFIPYLDAYERAGGQQVYVATDSVTVLDELNNATSSLTLHSQKDIVRSKDRTAVFKQTDSHDRTNVEVLIDILALSKCDFFLHGRSAVSEAVFYLNLDLHHSSIDLEDGGRYTSKDFEHIVRTKLEGSLVT